VTWEGLSPPYATIVADPPWSYPGGWPVFAGGKGSPGHGADWLRPGGKPRVPYSFMNLEQIAALPVADLAARDAHLYLWTTNRYLRHAFGIAEAWGFEPSKVLTWCKAPMGLGPGGTFVATTEFVIFARRGSLPAKTRIDTTWWQWKRPPKAMHSAKPPAFLDLVEQVSPGPYVDLFTRQQRLGWDSWGWGYELPTRPEPARPRPWNAASSSGGGHG
jgi:N6-adenosine-specific RNA methylase IME4